MRKQQQAVGEQQVLAIELLELCCINQLQL
jgi:hypothetical protein